MALSGTFESFSLPDLLQLIGTSAKTGRLVITHDRSHTRLYFQDGRLIACSSDDPPKLLGQFLIYTGLITEAQLREALSLQTVTRRRMDRILTSLGAVTEQQLAEAVAMKAEETVLGLFDIPSAAFQFEDGAKPDPMALDVDFDVQDIALRGMKRLDDREAIYDVFGDPGTVPRKVSQPGDDAAEWDWPTAKIFLSIDGERTVRDLALLVHGTGFLVRKILYDLREKNLIAVDRVVSVPEEASDADPNEEAGASGSPDRRELNDLHDMIVEGDFEEVFDRLDAAFESDPNNPYLRELMTEAEDAFLEAMEREGYSPAKVPVPLQAVGEQMKLDLNPAEGHILGLCDGNWDIQSLLWILPMRQFDVVSTLRSLEERGILALLEPSDERLHRGFQSGQRRAETAC